MIQIFSASTVGIKTQDGGMFQNRTAEGKGRGKKIKKGRRKSSRKHVVPSAQPFWKFVLVLEMQFYAVSRASPSSIILRLLFRLSQPSEEGRDGLEGDAFTLLLSRVFACLPLVERVLRDDVLIIQAVKEHPKEVCEKNKRCRCHIVKYQTLGRGIKDKWK